jgi:DNA-binding NtrC family response regulator
MPSYPPDQPDGRAYLILIVEDEILIALDLSASLEENGFEVLGPAASVEAALLLLARRRPDAAVLDLNLRKELVTPVARVLHGMHVPFLISSACPVCDIPTESGMGEAPKLPKPTSSLRMAAILNEMVAAAQPSLSSATAAGRLSRRLSDRSRVRAPRLPVRHPHARGRQHHPGDLEGLQRFAKEQVGQDGRDCGHEVE